MLPLLLTLACLPRLDAPPTEPPSIFARCAADPPDREACEAVAQAYAAEGLEPLAKDAEQRADIDAVAEPLEGLDAWVRPCGFAVCAREPLTIEPTGHTLMHAGYRTARRALPRDPRYYRLAGDLREAGVIIDAIDLTPEGAPSLAVSVQYRERMAIWRPHEGALHPLPALRPGREACAPLAAGEDEVLLRFTSTDCREVDLVELYDLDDAEVIASWQATGVFEAVDSAGGRVLLLDEGLARLFVGADLRFSLETTAVDADLRADGQRALLVGPDGSQVLSARGRALEALPAGQAGAWLEEHPVIQGAAGLSFFDGDAVVAELPGSTRVLERAGRGLRLESKLVTPPLRPTAAPDPADWPLPGALPRHPADLTQSPVTLPITLYGDAPGCAPSLELSAWGAEDIAPRDLPLSTERVTLPYGRWQLYARCGAVVVAQVNVDLKKQVPEELALQWPAPKPRQVLGSDGAPLVGARVALLDHLGLLLHEARTDESGRALLQHPVSGASQLVVFVDGAWRPTLATQEKDKLGPRRLLHPDTRPRVRVVDVHGVGVPGAFVEVSQQPAELRRSDAEGWLALDVAQLEDETLWVRAHKDGARRSGRLPQGGSLTLYSSRVRVEGFAAVVEGNFGQSHDSLRYQDRQGKGRVVLLDANADVLDDVSVVREADHIELVGVPPGTWRLLAQRRDGATLDLMLEVGEDEALTVSAETWAPPQLVRGRALDASGLPLPAEVKAFSDLRIKGAQFEVFDREVLAGPDGNFAIAAPPGGPFWVATGTPRGAHAVYLEAPETVSLIVPRETPPQSTLQSFHLDGDSVIAVGHRSAWAGQLQVGDRLLAVNGVPLADLVDEPWRAHLAMALRTPAVLQVERQGETLEFEAAPSPAQGNPFPLADAAQRTGLPIRDGQAYSKGGGKAASTPDPVRFAAEVAWVSGVLTQDWCQDPVCLPAGSELRWSPDQGRVLSAVPAQEIEAFGLRWAAGETLGWSPEGARGVLAAPAVVDTVPLAPGPLFVQLEADQPSRVVEGCTAGVEREGFRLPAGLCVDFTEAGPWVVQRLSNPEVPDSMTMRVGQAELRASSVWIPNPGYVSGRLAEALVHPSGAVFGEGGYYEHSDERGIVTEAGEVATAWSARGVDFPAGARVIFTDGALSGGSGVLTWRGLEVEYLGFDRGGCTELRVRTAGRLQGVSYAPGSACVFDSGLPSRLQLGADTVFDGVPLAAGNEVRFHADGSVLSGVLASEWAVAGFRLPAGSWVTLLEDERRASVPKDGEAWYQDIPLMPGREVEWSAGRRTFYPRDALTIDGVPLAADTRVELSEAGAVMAGTLGEPAELGGERYPAGFRFVVREGVVVAW